MARYTRKRSTARPARGARRSYSRARSPRASYGRKRSYSRSSARSGGSARTIRIVVEQVAAPAAVGPSLIGMKQAATPKVAKF